MIMILLKLKVKLFIDYQNTQLTTNFLSIMAGLSVSRQFSSSALANSFVIFPFLITQLKLSMLFQVFEVGLNDIINH